MKRFHVHVSVNDLARSIRFYSAIFGATPTVVKGDYAKWMLEDPRINFAISERGDTAGVNHLGLQVDGADELTALRRQVSLADIAADEEPAAECCYALSDKYWIEDPQGVAWETFHTLGHIPMFGKDHANPSPAASACCTPAAMG
ncbi:MAG: ArsI/CadI family heavy metal resistance metalloenzyme [Dokdonella sp.]|uniref:ArsI/CadI family heavy metal resistance metalloenzyme n=1 Tax=Dokdonella sp. TaxID=2291710 RepID=UPI003267DB78